MKIKKIICLPIGLIILSALPACNLLSQNQGLNTNTNGSATTPENSKKSNQSKPLTKTAVINVGGEKLNINLNLYQQPNPRLSTYFPDKYFEPESKTFPEGTVLSFYVNIGGQKDENAYIKFIFPKNKINLSEVRKLVSSSDGLIISQGWQVGEKSNQLPYSWAKEKISFHERQGNQEFTGDVIIGESKGAAFYVVSYYKEEYKDSFESRAKVIFQNLQFGS